MYAYMIIFCLIANWWYATGGKSAQKQTERKKIPGQPRESNPCPPTLAVHVHYSPKVLLCFNYTSITGHTKKVPVEVKVGKRVHVTFIAFRCKFMLPFVYSSPPPSLSLSLLPSLPPSLPPPLPPPSPSPSLLPPPLPSAITEAACAGATAGKNDSTLFGS